MMGCKRKDFGVTVACAVCVLGSKQEQDEIVTYSPPAIRTSSVAASWLRVCDLCFNNGQEDCMRIHQPRLRRRFLSYMQSLWKLSFNSEKALRGL